MMEGFDEYIADRYGKGEGNCPLSAMFVIMQYLRDYKGMDKFPKTDKEIVASDVSFYQELIDEGYIEKDDNNPVSSIYCGIRENANNYGYKANSTAWTSIKYGEYLYGHHE